MKNILNAHAKPILVYCLLFLFFGTSYCQIPVLGELNPYIYGIIDSMPGKDENTYRDPTPEAFQKWKSIISQLLAENYTDAATQAEELKYTLFELTDGNSVYYILQKHDTSLNYWGTYVFNPNALHDLVIQSPHPKYDLNTGKESIYVFNHTHSRFFCLSGTHRCNHADYSDCTGETSVCSSSSESYRISDMPHNINSIFHATTEALHEFNNSFIFIQLHGFAKQTTDPYVILSNGTRFTPNMDYIPELADNLVEADPVLTYKIGHIDLDWDRLLAFENVQGRFLNASTDPCFLYPDTSYGLFIHIEQEKTRLRADSTGWDKMVYAINNTFLYTGIDQKNDPKISLWPNPACSVINISHSGSLNNCEFKIFTASGVCVLKAEVESGQVDISSLDRGFYIIKVIANGMIISKPLVKLMFEIK
jgi:hypothetical protein